MALLFDLKQSVTGLFSKHKASTKITVGQNDMSKSEENMFDGLISFESNAESAQKSRSQNKNVILELQDALARADSRDESKSYENFLIEKRTIKEWREYEKNLRNQVNDIKIIIELLKKIIDAEQEEVRWDIEAPLKIIEEYFNRLKKILKDRNQKQDRYPEFQSLIDEMKASFQELIGMTLKYADNESKYFNEDISLSVYFKTRSKLKKQLNDKTQAILAEINKLEDALSSIDSRFKQEFRKALLENLAYFKKQFKELIRFCMDRVQISNRIRLEATALQKKKLEEIDGLKKTLDSFYSDFLKQQKEFVKKESAYLGNQASKRIIEYSNYWKSLSRDTKRLDAFIVSIEDEDLRLLKKESDVSSIRRRIPSWNKRFEAMIGVLTAVSILGANQLADNSSISTSGTALLKSDSVKDNITVTASNTSARGASIDYADVTGNVSLLLDPLSENWSMDPALRKQLIAEMNAKGNKIDSSLASISVGKRDYLKSVLLKKEYESNKLLLKGPSNLMSRESYIAQVQKAIISNNPDYKNKRYLNSLIDKYTPKMLPSMIHTQFIKAILSVESNRDIFAVSPKGASGPYQIMRGTWYSFTDLDYDTFVWDPEISLIVALKYIRYLNSFMARNDPDWSSCDASTKLDKIVAAYNCGEGAFQEAGFNIDNAPDETRDYVVKIRKFLS